MTEKKIRKKAAALGYSKESGDNTGIELIAKGHGLIAGQIIAKAAEHNIPVKEDPDLVEALSKLDLYQDIPEELYRAAAEILAEIYRINKNMMP